MNAFLWFASLAVWTANLILALTAGTIEGVAVTLPCVFIAAVMLLITVTEVKT